MSMNNAGLPNQPDKAFPAPTPSLVTTLSSGTGTFTPQPTSKWLRVTLVGAGGGGGGTAAGMTGAASGGKSGAQYSIWLKKTAVSYSYAVGAAGTGTASANGNAGGDTTFGSLTAKGGPGGAGVLTAITLYMDPVGQSGLYGAGGIAGATGTNASGNGAGGGGSNVAGNPGGSGSGGLIIVEEY